MAGYADEEAALYIIDLQQVQFFLTPAHHDVSAFVLCAVYDIGYNGTCGRKLSCSASVEHGITQYISVDEDGVEDTVYAVQRVFRVNHHRAYHGVILITHLAACCEQFDCGSHRGRIFDILCGDLCDSLGVNLFVIDFFSIGKRRKNRNFTAGIVAFYVCFRVALCVAKALCLF